MKFAPGTSQAQMAAAAAALAANKPKFKSDMLAAATRGDVKQAVIPGRGPKPSPAQINPVRPIGGPKPTPLPIRGVGTNDGGPKPMPSTGGPRPTMPNPRVATGPSPMPTPMAGAGPMPMKKGGSVGSASKRADGCATKGKTKGRMI